MTDEKWQDTIGQIKDLFTVEEEGSDAFDDGSGTKDWIVFEGPAGRVKLERVSRKVLLGERSLGARRSGANQSVVKEFSDEVIQSVIAFRWNGEDWAPVNADALLRATGS